MLSEGIQAACGNELKAMLRVLSYNRFVGFLTGIAVCAITNSLSCVAVLLMRLPPNPPQPPSKF